jgi:hypothetical protein
MAIATSAYESLLSPLEMRVIARTLPENTSSRMKQLHMRLLKEHDWSIMNDRYSIRWISAAGERRSRGVDSLDEVAPLIEAIIALEE